MKTLWRDLFQSKRHIANEFGISESSLQNCKILLATYTYADYSGSAFVLYIENGKLYEVHGSHCSCYGLEGQWDAEETTPEALKFRVERDCYFDGFTKEEVLNAIQRYKNFLKRQENAK